MDHTDKHLIKAYYEEFGRPYHGKQIFEQYPETQIIPQYIKQHFAQARLVLDLGFGTGLWFWASFLPALERIDGMDLHREALDEADRVFETQEVPEGFRLVHEGLGDRYTLSDLKKLQTKRGRFFFLDYREPWPDEVLQTRYDLVTEHGGGLGQMNTDEEVIGAVRKMAAVLRPSGHLLFANFTVKPSKLEQATGRVAGSSLCLRRELFTEAMEQAGLRMVDFHAVDDLEGTSNVRTLFYGYAQKPRTLP